MSIQLAPTNKVFRKDELLGRYAMFSTEAGQPLSERTLEKWRKERGFPKPIVSRPRVVFLKSSVLEWELKQGWDVFLEGHGDDQ